MWYQGQWDIWRLNSRHKTFFSNLCSSQIFQFFFLIVWSFILCMKLFKASEWTRVTDPTHLIREEKISWQVDYRCFLYERCFPVLRAHFLQCESGVSAASMKLLVHPLDSELMDFICSELQTLQQDYNSEQKPKWWEEFWIFQLTGHGKNLSCHHAVKL